MEKCHPLQEGLARPERSASLPLSPHPRRDGAADPSVSSPPVALLGSGCGGSRGPGARAGRDGFPPSSGLAPAAPPGLPAHVPPGFLRPRPFGGGMAGTVGDIPPPHFAPGRTQRGSVGAGRRAQNPPVGSQLRVCAHPRSRVEPGQNLTRGDPGDETGGDRKVCTPRSSLTLCPTRGPSSPLPRDSSSPAVIRHEAAQGPLGQKGGNPQGNEGDFWDEQPRALRPESG